MVSRLKKSDREREELDEAVSLVKPRILVALAAFAVVFILSFIISGRSGWPLGWLISFFSSFINLGVTTVVTAASIVVIFLIWFLLPSFVEKRQEVSKTRSKTVSVTVVSLAAMMLIGLVIPVSAWVEGRGILPSVNFNTCIDSLRGSAAVIVNDGDSNSKFATIASSEHGVQKYALEPDGRSWTVTDMYSNEKVTNMAGCND